jgi:HEAT repeat protein
MPTAKKLAVVIVACCAAAGSSLRLSCEEPPGVAALFQKLRSAQKTNAATEELEKLGKSDPKAREYLAIHLPAVIEKDSGQPWMNAVRLAGALKIAEAAPALAKWIGLDNIGEITTAGFVRLETNPAGKALSEIGDPAIPALVGILEHGSSRERRSAVYALNLIASPRAKTTLREHLKREPDENLREFIEKALAS